MKSLGRTRCRKVISAFYTTKSPSQSLALAVLASAAFFMLQRQIKEALLFACSEPQQGSSSQLETILAS